MSDANPDAEDTVRGSGEPAPVMPRWVKVSLIVASVLLLVLVVLKVSGVAGRHGPGMHRGGEALGRAATLETVRSGAGL